MNETELFLKLPFLMRTRRDSAQQRQPVSMVWVESAALAHSDKLFVARATAHMPPERKAHVVK